MSRMVCDLGPVTAVSSSILLTGFMDEQFLTPAPLPSTSLRTPGPCSIWRELTSIGRETCRSGDADREMITDASAAARVFTSVFAPYRPKYRVRLVTSDGSRGIRRRWRGERAGVIHSRVRGVLGGVRQ